VDEISVIHRLEILDLHTSISSEQVDVVPDGSDVSFFAPDTCRIRVEPLVSNFCA
jgi:hypothetical protein